MKHPTKRVRIQADGELVAEGVWDGDLQDAGRLIDGTPRATDDVASMLDEAIVNGLTTVNEYGAAWTIEYGTP